MATDTSAVRTAPRTGFDDDVTLSGLDTLELAGRTAKAGFGRRLWAATWPKLVALAIVLAVWQVVVWSGWKSEWVLPGPAAVGIELDEIVRTANFWEGVLTTLRRGLTGFALAAAIGFVVGIAVARNRILRAAIGSMITSLQTMPSIAWFPLAILLFQLNESAIMFVVVLGAAPSIANGVISGVDYVPPLLLRAGKNIGATGLSLYAYVIAPASLPAIVAGLKQGWAFAWRSLLAGELLIVIAERPALGTKLELLRQLNDAEGVIAIMIAVFVVGVLADTVFSMVDMAVRKRYGVMEAS